MTLVLFWGAFTLVDGVLALAHAIMGDNKGSRWWLALIGVLGIVVGLLTFMMPGVTALVLLFFIAGWAIALGVFQIVGAIRLRKEIDNEWWLVLGGVLSVLFGVDPADRAGRGRDRADLGDRVLRHRVRRAAGDGGAEAETAQAGLTHEIRTVRLGAGATRRKRSRFRPGLPRLHRLQRRGRGARLRVELRGRAPLHRLRAGVGEPQSADVGRGAHLDAAARHGRAGAAVAQSGAARRAGRDDRSPFRAGGSSSASARAIATTNSAASAFRWRKRRSASKSRSA